MGPVFHLASLPRQRCHGVVCPRHSLQLPQTNPSRCEGVVALWAPILLVHLGGQDCIAAYNIEDNELWKRHVLTAMSQVSMTALLVWTNILYIPIPFFLIDSSYGPTPSHTLNTKMGA